jgi:hypothetical protein
MAQKTAARGRPKGTGLDDAGPLAAIAELIAANPGMKPTTAIKALGITDPSTVRRLRDKYQQRRLPRSEQPAAVGGRHPNPSPVSNVISLPTRSDAPRRSATGGNAPTPSRTADTAAADDAAPASDDHPAAQTAPSKPDLFAAAYAASIATAKTAIHLQYKSLWYAFHWSPYACAIRNAEFMRLVLSSLKEKDDIPR